MLTTILYVFCTTLRLFVYCMQTALFLRAILSWLPLADDNLINNLLYAVTEPVVLPVRVLMARLGAEPDLPVDMPFFVTMLIMTFLPYLLPAINL